LFYSKVNEVLDKKQAYLELSKGLGTCNPFFYVTFHSISVKFIHITTAILRFKSTLDQIKEHYYDIMKVSEDDLESYIKENASALYQKVKNDPIGMIKKFEEESRYTRLKLILQNTKV